MNNTEIPHNIENTNIKDEYKNLKRKYIALLKDHKKIIKDYEKCNNELLEVNEEKKFLKIRIDDLLKSKGFTLKDIAAKEEI